MRPTFFGFDIARSGIQASQSGLDVTGQNMANVNTSGYSRQTLDQTAISLNATSYKYMQLSSVKMANGVVVNGISQIRDQFLDIRFRKANAESGALSTSLSIQEDVESVFDETVIDGLIMMLGNFYTQLQAVSSNAGDVQFSNLARSAAQKVTETMNQYADQLADIGKQELFDLNIVAGDVNTLTNKVSQVNNTIKNELIQGNSTNELLDLRNSYLDKLSGYINISVENNDDGTVSLKTGENYLLDAANDTIANLAVSSDSGNIEIINQNDGNTFEISDGSMKGYLQMLNGKGSYATTPQEEYRGLAYFQMSIDSLASKFAETFNSINSVNENKPLFAGDDSGTITAGTIKISEAWLADPNYITTTAEVPAKQGMNDNIVKMINAMDSKLDITGQFAGTFEEFTTSLMSDISIDVNYTSDMDNTSKLILTSIQNQRESVMGVSLNDESVNLIKYQKAFEASARLMTVLDESLDTIINKMGVVGR